MIRKKHTAGDKPELIVTNYDLLPFMPHNSTSAKSTVFENESVDALREKLLIKSEALNMLGKQLEMCNKEKNEYKKMIDTLYDKNLTLKKTLYMQQNHVDAEDENNLLYASGSLFSGTTSPINSNNTDRHNTSKQAKSRSQKSTLKAQYLASVDTRSNPSLFNDIDSDDYVKILKDLIKTLQKEKYEIIQKCEEIQQELNDSRNDLRLLREQTVRQRDGSFIEGLNTSTPIALDINAIDLGVYETFKQQQQLQQQQQQQQQTKCFSASSNSTSASMVSSFSVSSALNKASSSSFKENLVKEIERLQEDKSSIENELRSLICQKEEIEVERDSYKDKYMQLNRFLLDMQNLKSSTVDLVDLDGEKVPKDWNSVLRSTRDRTRMSVCIDEIISQNKYLNESNRNLKNEVDYLKRKTTTKQSANKPSTTASSSAANNNTKNPQQQQQHQQIQSTTELDTRSEIISESSTINKKKIRDLLFRVDQYIESAEVRFEDADLIDMIKDLRSTVENLIEFVNDKLIANSHQKRVNKMLAERIQDLERQLKKCLNNFTEPSETTSAAFRHDLDESKVPY